MKRSIFLIAVVLGALILGSPTKAGDQEHKFFSNDFDKTHCWPSLTSKMRAAPPLKITNQGQVPAGKSPGVSLLGEDVSPMGFDPQLAVSPKYLLVLEAHSYVFYDRATNAPLIADGCVPVNAEFTDLFAPLLLPTLIRLPTSRMTLTSTITSSLAANRNILATQSIGRIHPAAIHQVAASKEITMHVHTPTPTRVISGF